MADGHHHITIGPPGCGKTTWLSRQVERAYEKSRNITVISLTRSSAAEVAGRDLPIPEKQVGTLHSQCFRALQGAQIAETSKHADVWNKENPQYRITPVGEEEGEPPAESEAASEGDRLLNEYKILRGKMEPRQNWPDGVVAFANRWEHHKQDNDVLDFTDLIETSLREIDQAPGEPDVIMVDEAQDMDRQEMALTKKWGLSAGYLVVVGDPDQCQPPGTIVQTATGPVPIEQIKPSEHVLTSWNPAWDRTSDTPTGFPTETTWRHYNGPMLTVSAGGRSSRSTPDHIWIAKIAEANRAVLWLENAGDRWTAHASTITRYNQRDPVRRPRAWALDSLESLEYASSVAAAINRQLAGGTAPHAILERYGRDPALPLMGHHTQRSWRPDTPWPIRACNLLPRVMALPLTGPQNQVSWERIDRMATNHYEGTVHSLRVEPHKTYVADGILTHNCLYEWRGSDPRVLMSQDAGENTRQVLSQSYRVSQRVHAKAMNWINRCPGRDTVEYRPTEVEGAVRYMDARWFRPQEVLRDAQRYLDQGKTIMIVASCSYMLDPVIREMREQALPFHNPLRTRNGAWNPLAKRSTGTSTTQRLLDFLHLSEYGSWNADQIRNWAGAVRLKDTFAGGKGIAKRLEELVDDDSSFDDDPCLSWEAIQTLLPEEAIDAALSGDAEWLRERLNKARRQPAAFPLEVIRRRGTDHLRNDPLLIPGTVNSLKGGEADVVYLFPDLSRSGLEQWHGTAQERAAIFRLFYVGMTRARETLIICQPSDSESAPEFWQGD